MSDEAFERRARDYLLDFDAVDPSPDGLMVERLADAFRAVRLEALEDAAKVAETEEVPDPNGCPPDLDLTNAPPVPTVAESATLPNFEARRSLCRLLVEHQNGVSDGTDEATLPDLLALIAALPDEAKGNVAEALGMSGDLIPKTTKAALDLLARDRDAQTARAIAAESRAEAAYRSAIDDAILAVHGVRRHYPLTMNPNPPHDALTRAINKLADLRTPAPPPEPATGNDD